MTGWRATAVILCLLGGAVRAEMPDAARSADVVFLGEIHDNPEHHLVQADWLTELAPAAVVFEMIEPASADSLPADAVGNPDVLAVALDWSGSGWPDFAIYAPVFAAAGSARIYGAALPRAMARGVVSGGAQAVLPIGDVRRFGLDRPLPDPEQVQREAGQMAAHCDALPEDMLPGMVAIQRVRDAMLARAALRAMRETGGPVAVITGNGHARRDWGAPAATARANPGVSVFALGQSEDGAAPDGTFDLVLDAPAPERDDPCAAFR